MLITNKDVDFLLYTEDAGEFVDMWLFLMERMVNVNSILDSPHALLASWKPPKKFDPLAFLVKTHKVSVLSILFVV